ncbi:hypothetical protein [Pseudoxanthomonas daejeonensis]|uniref:Uncharacterized protein n=1 Tax=Pseudoxanthomonas daejeonensis TaxID=266062 RepID=A0ABQ6Z966_9GAMM|nr:hypothetical protein [Pseudoxanthomonas daejeonensis]KAF1696019.1 hypothetical protein CSC65_05850 [Pseudoxanthomonas daejeonensis]
MKEASMKDPLDVAFIGMGVDTAFRDPTTGNYQGGQLELVGEVLAFGHLLDTHYETHFRAEGFPGCWAYEVAETFGEWGARQFMAGQILNPSTVQLWLDSHAPAEATR